MYRLPSVCLTLCLAAGCAFEDQDDRAIWLEDNAPAYEPFADDDFLAPPPGPRAKVVTPLGPFCAGSTQDILRPVSGSMYSKRTNPGLDVAFEKCDGSPFQTDKHCDVRVGSYEPWGVVRTSFVWPAGSRQERANWHVWPSASDFEDAPCGERKTFYLTCDDGAVVAHWRQEGDLTIEEYCPGLHRIGRSPRQLIHTAPRPAVQRREPPLP